MNTKTVISLQGRSCTGKSTVGDIIKQKYLGIYTVDYDKVKRQLSGYSHKTDAADMREMTLGFFEVACRTGKPLLLIATPFHNEAQYMQYKKIADAFGYEFFNFDFTASRDILIQRYRDRLESVNKEGKISIKTEEEYLKTLEEHFFIPRDSIQFDTTNDGAEAVAEQIVSMVSK